jgi:hypothetical protein
LNRLAVRHKDYYSAPVDTPDEVDSQAERYSLAATIAELSQEEVGEEADSAQRAEVDAPAEESIAISLAGGEPKLLYLATTTQRRP